MPPVGTLTRQRQQQTVQKMLLVYDYQFFEKARSTLPRAVLKESRRAAQVSAYGALMQGSPLHFPISNIAGNEVFAVAEKHAVAHGVNIGRREV